MNLYTPSKAAHWYSTDGKPMHDAKLPLARKLGLLPSVTTIQRAAAKPGLESWKMTQAVLSALTLPRLDGEPDDAFAERVVEDSKREAADAADWGTRMHEVCNVSLAVGNDTSTQELLEDIADRYNLTKHAIVFNSWREQNVATTLFSEEVVTHRSGYAGRLDAGVILREGRRKAVVDFKGRSLKGKKLTWYPEQVQQLAAYRLACIDCGRIQPGEDVALLSVVIDREEPEIYTKLWTQEEAETGEKQFMTLLAYWQALNKFWPSRQMAA